MGGQPVINNRDQFNAEQLQRVRDIYLHDTKSGDFEPFLAWLDEAKKTKNNPRTPEETRAYVAKETVVMTTSFSQIQNSQVTGKTVSITDKIGSFDPEKYAHIGKARVKNISFKGRGASDSPSFIWSGGVLMDLDRKEALKMQRRSVNGTEYLFIEAGGFSPTNPAGWQSEWLVLKRK